MQLQTPGEEVQQRALLEEAAVALAVVHDTLKRRLPAYAREPRRHGLGAADGAYVESTARTNWPTSTS